MIKRVGGSLSILVSGWVRFHLCFAEKPYNRTVYVKRRIICHLSSLSLFQVSLVLMFPNNIRKTNAYSSKTKNQTMPLSYVLVDICGTY